MTGELAAFVLGILGGLLLGRRFAAFPADGYLTAFVYLLLFFLGVGAGSDPALMTGLEQLGFSALLLALAGMAGSAGAALLLGRFCCRKLRGQ